ncbi:MAG: hypothetical protein HY764_02240 [Candidatus Portnoybacteria bacterium]|nr:hypothetical protein [Candidatus Portnoybacteria bacterium]
MQNQQYNLYEQPQKLQESIEQPKKDHLPISWKNNTLLKISGLLIIVLYLFFSPISPLHFIIFLNSIFPGFMIAFPAFFLRMGSSSYYFFLFLTFSYHIAPALSLLLILCAKSRKLDKIDKAMLWINGWLLLTHIIFIILQPVNPWPIYNYQPYQFLLWL